MIQNIGIIMDGNRRWAKKQGKSAFCGHSQGAQNLINIANFLKDKGVPNMVVYALSTENLKRIKEELDALFNLFEDIFTNKLKDLLGDSSKVRFIGNLSLLPSNLQTIIKKAEEINPNAKHTIWIALAYGGRAEIVEAVKKAVKNHIILKEEDDFKELMWSAQMPDPDLIIRTGGDKRISNFLLWQTAYTELFFTDTLWPDFGTDELTKIMREFESRDRRFGK